MPTLLGTAATAAKFAIALAAIPAPTVTPIPEPAKEQMRPATRSASRSPLLQTDARLPTVAANLDIGDVAIRPTTTYENIIGEIRQWSLLDANWDGEGAALPNARSMKEAVSFVRLFDDRIALPEPMLLASGHVALYWNEADLYADIEFLGDSRIAYFIKKGSDKHKGVLTFDSTKMPAVFSALIAA